jgi:hypothetical protein
MTPTETRCAMTQLVMPMHTGGVAGAVMTPRIDACAGVAAMRAAGRTGPERQEPPS